MSGVEEIVRELTHMFEYRDYQRIKTRLDVEQQIERHLLADSLIRFCFFFPPLVVQLSDKPVIKLDNKKERCGMHLSHVDCKRLGPAVKQLEEKQALMRWYFICIVDHKHVIRFCSHHP